MKERCVHCGLPRSLTARQLCSPCYKRPSVRSLYPPKIVNGNGPTLADLDALVAERSKPENLPKWWKDEAKRSEARLKAKDNHRARDRKRRSRTP